MNIGLFDSLPISGVYIGLTAGILLSFEVGYQISKYTSTRYDKEAPNAISPMVGGLLGMLAFVLAFTFAMAAAQHNLRKQNVLDEANAIGTAYLRADLVDEPHRTKVKHLLQEYVDIRLQAVEMGMSTDILKTAIARSVELHELLWAQVSSAAKKEPNINTGLLLQSINNVIDMHEKRLTAALRNRIPGSIWLALLAISALTMITMGAQAGLSKSRRLVAVIPLIMAFAALTTVVVDLDRPQKGLIKVGQQTMINLQSSMSRQTK
ncbi:MAG: hypothetical protein U9Q62_01785 [Campylobacterota bacterium]|nr:hypothetical protein [Campylobacterota bacterium]